MCIRDRIVVAILGRNHPAGVLPTALLFGIMDMGSLRMSRETMVSTNMVTVIQSRAVRSTPAGWFLPRMATTIPVNPKEGEKPSINL